MDANKQEYKQFSVPLYYCVNLKIIFANVLQKYIFFAKAQLLKVK